MIFLLLLQLRQRLLGPFEATTPLSCEQFRTWPQQSKTVVEADKEAEKVTCARNVDSREDSECAVDLRTVLMSFCDS